MADARDEAFAGLQRLFGPAVERALSDDPNLIRETARKLDAWADEVEQRTQRNLAWVLPFFRKVYGNNNQEPS